MNKKNKKTHFSVVYFSISYFINNKKGEMEMWQIIVIVLALILLIVAIIAYSNWGSSIEELLGRFGGLM